MQPVAGPLFAAVVINGDEPSTWNAPVGKLRDLTAFGHIDNSSEGVFGHSPFDAAVSMTSAVSSWLTLAAGVSE